MKVPARNSIKHFQTYIFAILPTSESNKDLPSETLLKVPAYSMICYFPCQVLATVPIRDSNKNDPSETLLKVQLGARPNNFKVKLSKVKLYLFTLGLQSNTCQVSFSYNSNPGLYEFPSKAFVNFQERGWSNISQATYIVIVATCNLNIEFRS